MRSVTFWKYSGVRGKCVRAVVISARSSATLILSLTMKTEISVLGESEHHQSAPPTGTFEAVMQLMVYKISV